MGIGMVKVVLEKPESTPKGNATKLRAVVGGLINPESRASLQLADWVMREELHPKRSKHRRLNRLQ